MKKEKICDECGCVHLERTEREKEFEKLQNQNEKLTKKIDDCLIKGDYKMKRIWSLINQLIENELEQEELCD